MAHIKTTAMNGRKNSDKKSVKKIKEFKGGFFRLKIKVRVKQKKIFI
jgi:hypothetical protein